MPASSELKDYIYPYSDQPSYSNYGTAGLLQMPTARFLPEGSMAFTWSHYEPYLRGSLVAYPFDWFEASYQYTDINNKLYSDNPAFSGSQSYKDKGFDAKFRLVRESKYMPAIALGVRDLGGTALFSAEYLVATKRIRNVDLTGGIGWGVMDNNNISNPLGKLSGQFYDRSIDSREGVTSGGELNASAFFRGENAGLFGGAEIFIPKAKGLRFKIEYDATNYEKESYEPLIQDSKWNFGFVFPLSRGFQIKMGYSRGNTLNFGFSYAGLYGKKDPVVKKDDPPIPIKNARTYKYVNSLDKRNLYKTSLKFLKDNEKFYLQSAHLDKNKYHITFTQNKHGSYPRMMGRAARILNQLAPDEIDTFVLTNLNAEMPLLTYELSREDFNRYMKLELTEPLLSSSKIYKTSSENISQYEYQPITKLPLLLTSFAPQIRSQIGGPDGFYFGDISLSLRSELIIKENLTLVTSAGIGLLNNFDDLKLASESTLPHVRTDIVKYLKQSKKAHITRMQFNYFSNPFGSFYYKISGGLMEQMFGGVGVETLYRPFKKDYGIGFEVWRVKQRSYRQLFSFKEYETTTGHLNLYFKEPKSQVLFSIKAGRFLAEDSGINFDFKRRFKSGLTLGAFFSRTDISFAEYGEGSFDKGWYFSMPIEIFSKKHSKQISSFGLRPLTRDGAVYLVHGHHLYGVTDQGVLSHSTRDWDDIYD
jgi:hypothetical protein